MNNRGFAITGLLYTIMLVFIVFTMMILFDLQNKKTILDELKSDAVLALDDDASLSAILDRLEVLENENNNRLNKTYPIGSIYISVTNTNPASTLGGTWVSWGSGKVPVGVDTSQTEFNTVEKTGGSKTTTLNDNNIPSSFMIFKNFSGTNWSTGVWGAATYSDWWASVPHNGNGGYTSSDYGQSFTNLQPYITAYMWKRTA